MNRFNGFNSGKDEKSKFSSDSRLNGSSSKSSDSNQIDGRNNPVRQNVETDRSNNAPNSNEKYKGVENVLLEDAVKSDYRNEQNQKHINTQEQKKQEQMDLQQQHPKQDEREAQSGTDQQQKRDGQQRQQTRELEKRFAKQTGQVNSSQQHQQSWPSRANISASWQKNLAAAKILWGKLTDNEILQSEGRIDKLIVLVEERYAISPQEANKQVNKFISEFNVK